MRTDRMTREAPRGFFTHSLAFLAAGLVGLAGCDLGVQNPALIEEGDLATPLAVPAIVNGALGSFGIATTINGGGGTYTVSGMLTDELVHSGSWVPLREISDGLGGNESPENQSHWGNSSQARWQAEDAIVKAQELVDNAGSNQWVALAQLYAGFSNRVMGDMFCDAVIDGGPLQPHTAFLDRALGFFSDAIATASAGGHTTLENAARAGRAQTYMSLGQWSEAVSDAQQVAIDFRYDHVHSDNSGAEQNGVHNWAGRDAASQMSVWSTPFADWGLESNGAVASEGDPRAPFRVLTDAEGDPMMGPDNRRPQWLSDKYPTRNSDIALAKGTEMRLIEAEALLRDGSVGPAVDLINEVRDFHGLADADAGDIDEAWALLIKERGLELWLEGRRLGDMRRWADTPAATPHASFMVVRDVAAGQPADEDPRANVLEASPLCLRVSTNEIFSNPNLGGTPR